MVVVVGVLLVLGILAGVVWWLVVTPAEFTKLPHGGQMGEDQLGRQFGADAWYVVIAVPTGLVAGGLLTWWRSAHVLGTVAALLLGAVVAAAAMSLTGHLLGPQDPTAALGAAKLGSRVPESLDVGLRPVWPLWAYLEDTISVYLSWPVGLLVGALLVLVGRGPEDQPTPAPDTRVRDADHAAVDDRDAEHRGAGHRLWWCWDAGYPGGHHCVS
jgi:hypothetical protein